MPGSAFLAFLRLPELRSPDHACRDADPCHRLSTQGFRMPGDENIGAKICEFGLRSKVERAIEPYERDIGFGRFARLVGISY
jgi:hypothetical protein